MSALSAFLAPVSELQVLRDRCASLRYRAEQAELGRAAADHRIEQLCAFIHAHGLDVPAHVFTQEAA